MERHHSENTFDGICFGCHHRNCFRYQEAIFVDSRDGFIDQFLFDVGVGDYKLATFFDLACDRISPIFHLRIQA